MMWQKVWQYRKDLWGSHWGMKVLIKRIVSLSFRSSRSCMFYKIGVLKNFTGKHLESLFNEFIGLRRFALNFAKFLKASFLQSTSGQILLNLYRCFSENLWKTAFDFFKEVLRNGNFYQFKFHNTLSINQIVVIFLNHEYVMDVSQISIGFRSSPPEVLL